MTRDEFLAFYDQDQRIDDIFPGSRREVTPDVIRQVDLSGRMGMVIYSRLDASNADAVIEAQIAYYEGIGQDFEWKVFGHDQPADLKDRLARRGFEIEEAEALLVLDLASPPPVLLAPPAHEVTRITDPDKIADVMAVQNKIWDEDFSWLGDYLVSDLRERPDTLSVYVVFKEGVPVSSAWLRFREGSPFASMWGGSTLDAYRGQGIYTALLAVRVQEAQARGVRFLTIDASPMSRPIVEKHGFQFITHMYACTWHVSKNGV
jgi:GNAT superfamily N-acetyltransferase